MVRALLVRDETHNQTIRGHLQHEVIDDFEGHQEIGRPRAARRRTAAIQVQRVERAQLFASAEFRVGNVHHDDAGQAPGRDDETDRDSEIAVE